MVVSTQLTWNTIRALVWSITHAYKPWSSLKIRLPPPVLRIILSGRDRDPLISTVEKDCLERHLFFTESPSWKQSKNNNYETRTRAHPASNIAECKLTHIPWNLQAIASWEIHEITRLWVLRLPRLALARGYGKSFAKKISLVKCLEFQASFAGFIKRENLKQMSSQSLNQHCKILTSLHQHR